MTNTYALPESDRIAEYVNPVLDQIAGLTPEQADLVEIGAVTVIGLVDESLRDLHAEVVAQAEAVGIPAEVAEAHFNTVAESIIAKVSPRTEALRKAVNQAQGYEEPDLDVLLKSALAALLGEEAAAEFLASVEDVEVEVEDDDPEDEEVEYDQAEAEEYESTDEDIERLLADLFGRRP